MNEFLFSPTKQFVFPSGKILAGGKVYVFIKHTNTLATLYNDEGVEIANPVILDSNGRATVLADDTYEYKMDVYTPDDELLFTATGYLTDNYEKDFAVISTDGSVSITPSISGYTDVWDLSVSGKFDTSAFENFYTNTYGPTVGDIYHKINDISATVSGGYDGKLDVTAFNLYSAGVRGDLNIITGNTASISYNTAMLDDKILQNTNNINSVSGGLNTLYNIVIPEIRTDIIDVSSKLDTVSAKVGNKLDSTAFDDFISGSYAPNMSTIFSDIGSLKTNKFDSSAFSSFIDDSYGPNMSTIYQGLGNLSSNKQDKITWEYNADGKISAADGSAFAGNGGYYSKYQPYGLNAISGNLVIEGSRYPRQTLIGVSSDNSASTAGIIPPVPEQNLTAERYLVAASGSLADVSWKEIPNFDSIQSNSATWNEVSSKLDTTSFSTVSGDFYPYSNPSGFITGVDLSDYYTKNETSGADELANAFNNIPAGDEEVNNTVHTYSGDWNSTYTTVHSNSASWAQGGSFTGVTTDATLTGDGLNSPLGVADTQTMSSNESISITTAVNGVILGVNSSWFDNAVNSAVTGTQGDAEVNAAVHNNSATWNNVTNKLDTTAFSDVSGTFLTAHQSLDDYATKNYVQTNSAEITAMIPTDYYPNTNPSGFITGVDLTPYQTTAGMSDYQTTANMTAYEPKINYGYSAGAVSSINGSAILGETIPYEVYGISAGDNITIWEDNNALWISAASTDLSNYYTKTDTSSKQELSDAIGNVETLLASL